MRTPNRRTVKRMSEMDVGPTFEASTPYVQTVPTALASLYHKSDLLALQRMMLVVKRITVPCSIGIN